MGNVGAGGTLTVPLLLCLASCMEPLRAPSAFSSERYLCDQEHADEFDTFVEECRQAHVTDQSCDGVMSFRGTIDRQPFAVETAVRTVTYQDLLHADGNIERRIVLSGLSPYFAFRVDLEHFGRGAGESKSGPVPEESCLRLGGGVTCTSSEILNIEARGGNFLSRLQSEIREIRLETADELRVALTATISRGGTLDGCFGVFPPPPITPTP